MPWLRSKRSRFLLATFGVLLIIAIAGFTWLLTTEAGLVRAIAMLESLDKVSIRVNGAKGRLIGPITAETIDIEHARATIRITGFSADYEPSELLAGRIAAEGVHARTIKIQVLERQQAATKAPAFAPGWLSIAVDDVTVDDLSIISPRGTALQLKSVAGSATISRSQIAFENARADAGAWAIAGAGGRLFAREPLGIQGTAAWTVTEGREIGGVLRALGDLDRLTVDLRFALPATGQANVVLTRLTSDLQWRGKAVIESLDLARWTDAPPFGPLRATLDVSGDRFEYATNGVVHGDGLPASGVQVKGTAAYADRVVTLSGLTMSIPDSMVAELRGRFIVAEQPVYDLQAEWTDFRWPLTGDPVLRSPRGDMAMNGWREFGWRVNGEFDPLVAPPFSGRASGQFTTTRIVVDDAALRALKGNITVQGWLARGAGREWAASGHARGIDPAAIRPELAGKLDFDFRGSGSGFGEGATYSATLANLGGRFRGQTAGGGGTIHRERDRTRFERVALSLGSAQLALDGAIGAGEELDARLVADDLSVFLPELRGHVNANVQLRDRSYALAMTGHNLAWGKHEATILSADGHVDLDDREMSWLRVRSNGLVIAGMPLTDTRLSASGQLRDHSIEFRVGAGEDAVSVRGRGAYVDSQFTLQMQEVTAVGPRTPSWRLETTSSLSVSAGDAALAPACLVAGDRRVCVEGRWQREGNWSVRARTEDFAIDTLDQRTPGRLRYRGLLTVDATASARAGQPWIADISAGLRESVLEYESASGKTHRVPMGRAVLSLKSNAQQHALDLRVLDATDTSLTAQLTATRIAGRPLRELPVSGNVNGATGQLGLLPLLFTGIDQASGRLRVGLDIAGRLAAPSLTGQAELTDGAFDFYQANLRLRDTTATIALQQESLELKATAKAGEGSLDVDGRLGWRDRRLSGELTMKGDRLLLVDVPEARVFASPDLRFTLADRRIGVTGSVTVPEARIRPAETAGAVLASADERIVRPEFEEEEDERFEIVTDVRLVLGNRVDLDAYGLSGRVSGSVRARTSPHEAAVATGELEVLDGEYRAYSRELEVERGRLLFTGGPATDPGVDLRASRKLGIHTVGVIVRGRLRQPQLTLFSEPPLPQAQIASLLIVGQSLDSLQSDDRDDLQSEQASLASQGGALLAGQLGRHVGLDDVGIAQSGDGAALVLGKFLSPRLYISYGISLVDEINTLKLRYTIGDRWVISLEAGSESAADIEYRIDR
jgi:translocation and assembly module TamB